jgi:hypothetical protein
MTASTDVAHDPRDRSGQATALTMYLRVRWWGAPFLRALFFGARHLGFVTAPLRTRQFIHFARWTLLRDVPGAGGRRRLRRSVLWFESNFDGDLGRYMDTFARALPWRMRAAWGPTEGFPGLFPLSRFHAWTYTHTFPAGHYHATYGEATTRDVGRALTVSSRFDHLLEEVVPAGVPVDVDTFDRAWTAFLTDVQVDL